MARVLLLRPPILNMPTYLLGNRPTPPIALAYLAGALRAAGHEPVVLDALGEGIETYSFTYTPEALAQGLTTAEILERIEDVAPFDAVAVTAMFTQDWPHTRSIIEAVAAKYPGTPIIVGGEHATAAAEHILDNVPEVTHVGRGEGEFLLVEFAAWIDGRIDAADISGLVHRVEGAVVDNGKRERITKLDTIPRPAWDLFDIEPYQGGALGYGVERGRSLPILATRGCPFQCTFCSSPQMWTTRYVMRDPKDVIDEIEEYLRVYDLANIDFYDLTAVVRKKWILEFCAEIQRRELKFIWQLPSGTRSEALDGEVLAAMLGAGCANVTYAPESGSPKVLKDVKKRVDLDRLTLSIREAARLGISTKMNLIIGFPEETRRDVWQTLTYSWKQALHGIDDAGIFLFSPYPGSELYTQLRAQGKIPDMTDEYCASLMKRATVDGGLSYCTRIGNLELTVYQMGGMVVFYLLSYLRRPSRILRSIRRFKEGRAETLFESRLYSFAKLRRAQKGALRAVVEQASRHTPELPTPSAPAAR
jgi:anaerobic magnesium-protoporphyrin IX monomethyl ester cyclase